MIKSVYSNTSLFGVEEAKLRPLERLLMSLEGQLLDGVILQVFSCGELYLFQHSCFSTTSEIYRYFHQFLQSDWLRAVTKLVIARLILTINY